MACSSRSASSCTSSHGTPTTSVRKRSMRRWRETISSASPRPRSVKWMALSASRVPGWLRSSAGPPRAARTASGGTPPRRRWRRPWQTAYAIGSGSMEIGEGTRALVTGASRGIGRALVEALAARGATVGLAARSTDELEALAATLPGAHHVLACDVTDADAVAATVETFIAAAGGLDLVV